MHESDIRRMAVKMKMKPAVFFETYLIIDDEGEYVFKQVPCPFLRSDNYCSIYENRPKACREYPHTNRKRFYQILDLAVRNSKVCPAVNNIFENLRSAPENI
jgi:Fe-S-cluster containining protein